MINSGCFKKGQVPWNKGKLGVCFNTGKTHFKKGSIPWNYGKPFSKEVKEKIRKANLGKRYSPDTEIKKGQHLSKKTEFKKGQFALEKNVNWKGNTELKRMVRDSLQYKKWREKIYRRDNYTCCKCGIKKSVRLNAHHIVPFYKIIENVSKDKSTVERYTSALSIPLLWDISNGVTLCEKCHKLMSLEKKDD
jgi:hypothetical protein